ncbi:MAG: type II toxin-antitoxin system HicA family toxin [Armatimonadetes bacterium]|nr:type II toxin-antitoxin system HicA family toxin [Armatimonadota bacterium]
MKVRELVRLLEHDGWSLVRSRGSHRHFQHPGRSGTITVSGNASRDVPPGTLAAILKAAGLKGSRDEVLGRD